MGAAGYDRDVMIEYGKNIIYYIVYIYNNNRACHPGAMYRKFNRFGPSGNKFMNNRGGSRARLHRNALMTRHPTFLDSDAPFGLIFSALLSLQRVLAAPCPSGSLDNVREAISPRNTNDLTRFPTTVFI